MDKYAVVGNPIEHSKSPQIHQAFAQQLGQLLSYEAILSQAENFEQDLRQFFSHGGMGLNITVPFKQQAFEFADDLSARAKLAGAVNTLIRNQDGSISGDNTDGAGLVEDICINHKIELKAKTILLLGAGGAVRGVIQPLLDQAPKNITIVNRTLSKAKELEKLFSQSDEVSGNIVVREYEQLINEKPFDIIINGTAASLSYELPPLTDNSLTKNTFCYDMMYGKQDTIFIAWAKDRGCLSTADGLGMLVEQAAVSFKLWRGEKPETKEVIKNIRSSL